MAELRSLPGVCSLTLNQTCGTLSVSYDPARLNVRELRERWIRSEKAARAGHGYGAAALAGLRWMPPLIEAVSALFARARA